jgi:hypothetical protein
VLETGTRTSRNAIKRRGAGGLGIEKTDSGFRLTLDECYGPAGSIEAEKMFLRLTPGKPS